MIPYRSRTRFAAPQTEESKMKKCSKILSLLGAGFLLAAPVIAQQPAQPAPFWQPPDWSGMTPEQIEAVRRDHWQRMQNMTEEQRRQMWEQRRAYRQQQGGNYPQGGPRYRQQLRDGSGPQHPGGGPRWQGPGYGQPPYPNQGAPGWRGGEVPPGWQRNGGPRFQR